MNNTRINIHSSLDELINFSQTKASAAESTSPINDLQGDVVEGIGWHLYADLRIHSWYVCDSDSAKRIQTMKALVKLGQVSLALAQKYGGQLLEHQGQRTHLWIPLTPSEEDRSFIRSALSELDFLVRKHVAPLIPSGWKSYASSADYGPTIFVRSADISGGDSIVSLSVAANRPAKVLFKLNDGDIWVDGKVYSAQQEQRSFDTEKRATANPEIVQANFSQRDAFAGQGLDKYARVHESTQGVEPSFGFVFRADMDGFSALVQGAFQSRSALEQLVSAFLATTRSVYNYAHSTPTAAFVQLPWAGDCCTLVAIEEDHAKYQASRVSKTVEIPIEFEDQLGSKVLQKNFHNVGWAYSVAGGDAHGNQLGNLLIANITLGHRTFLVAAGKGVRRSLDAETQIHIDKSEVSLFMEDKPHLKTQFKSEFNPGNSNFHLAKIPSLQRIVQIINAGSAAIVTSTSSSRPSPKPYSGQESA